MSNNSTTYAPSFYFFFVCLYLNLSFVISFAAAKEVWMPGERDDYYGHGAGSSDYRSNRSNKSAFNDSYSKSPSAARPIESRNKKKSLLEQQKIIAKYVGIDISQSMIDAAKIMSQDEGKFSVCL